MEHVIKKHRTEGENTFAADDQGTYTDTIEILELIR